MGAMHNRMNKCKKCAFEATSTRILEEHVQDEHNRRSVFACDKCEYESIIENNISEHKKNKHKKQTSQDGVYNRKESFDNKLCIFWNHGYCRNGIDCTFVHEEIPACPNQNNCKKIQCSLYHSDKSLNNFLGRTPVMRGNLKH